MKKTTHRKAPSSKPGKTSKDQRMEEEQLIHPVQFEMSESSESDVLEQTISALFGIPGVGKSKFVEQLGFALQKKYVLSASGVYVLQCERINHPWKIRKSILPTWPTFRKFVADAEADPAFVSTVKMWVIDTIDAIVPKGISTICKDMDVEDLKAATTSIGGGNWHAKGWEELRKEMLYQILRLANLGPGVLILSHERYKTKRVGAMEVERASMDVSQSIYNAVGDACSMILHMRTAGEYGKKADKTQPRCLASITSDDEEAKDNLGVILPHYPDGVIPFRTEKEVVDKLMKCFESSPSGAMKKTESKKTKKKIKKVKKVKRKER